MIRPARICTQAGCPAIATQGTRCAAHPIERKGRPWQHTKSAAERGYNSAHQAMRKAVLAEERTCRMCGAAASIADHITPLSRGGSHNRDNYQALCKPCSDRKSQAEATAGRRRARHRKVH